jgi:hypothetical protein
VCIWHHPDKAQEVADARRRGGINSSHTARAKKRFAGTDKDIATLWAKTMTAIEKVESGEMEPGQANALSGLIRAAHSLSSTVILSSELEALRREIADIRGSQVPA